MRFSATITINGFALLLYNVYVLFAKMTVEPTTTVKYYDLNVQCAPHAQVVETDETEKFRYIPYYVKLHRCLGKDINGNPSGTKCVPVGVELVTYTVETNTPQFFNLSLYNHTSCASVCTSDNSSCSEDQEWNETLCSCCEKVQSCEGEFIWNETLCTCACPSTSKNSCGKTRPPKPTSFLNTRVRIEYVCVITAAEALLVVTLCFVIFHYYCRGRGRKTPTNFSCALTHRADKRNITRNSDDVSEISDKEMEIYQNGHDKNDNEFSERERFLSF